MPDDKGNLTEDEAVEAYENGNPTDDHATGVVNVVRAAVSAKIDWLAKQTGKEMLLTNDELIPNIAETEALEKQLAKSSRIFQARQEKAVEEAKRQERERIQDAVEQANHNGQHVPGEVWDAVNK